MLTWITANAVTLITAAVVLCLIGGAAVALIKEKKSKTGVCCGNCAVCGAACTYAKKEKDPDRAHSA